MVSPSERVREDYGVDEGVPMSRKTRFHSRLNKLKHKPLVSLFPIQDRGSSSTPLFLAVRPAIRVYSSLSPRIPQDLLLWAANTARTRLWHLRRRVILPLDTDAIGAEFIRRGPASPVT